VKLNRKVILSLALVGLAVAVGAWVIWRNGTHNAIPAGIFSTNGRIEANQVDIATKIAGRVTEVVPREGDMIDAGAVAARLDQTGIAAALRQSAAEANGARDALKSAQAAVVNRRSELTFASQQLRRTALLAKDGWATREALDQRQQQEAGAQAGLTAALAAVEQASSTIAAADAHVDQLKTELGDATILSPARGRVEYRLVEPGAVLPAGGRILTLLDLADVYMTIFLPADVAGKLAIGGEARVVLDAAPQYVFPAKISFVAAEAQFTPKTVETSSEREKLMFRVRLQAPVEMLKTVGDRVKTGLRGTGYVRVDGAVVWPPGLVVKLPPP
jgi:HlyD family secretion protein